jgi:hypothetical protein
MTAKGETADREIRMMALEAYLDPVKKEDLKKLFLL